MKTILITGATAGFGAAAGRKFVGGGWNVVGTGRRADRLKALQRELGDAFLPLEIDMRDRESVESLAKLEAPWGDIDLLLNNAGLAPPTDPLPETEWNRVEAVIDTNITGLVALTRALMPKLVARKGRSSTCRRLPRITRTRAARFMPGPRRSSASSRSIYAATLPAPACA